ncbi:MAG: GxxExxY protein [Lentisphaeria bacterium]|nr:GxxExxY protein [Lentisphaeria bacterium]
MTYLHKDLTGSIIGAAMVVHNEIGHGLREKTYENGLCVELGIQKIRFGKQSRYPVFYRDVQIDEFIPDMVVDERVIVENKVVESITDEHVGQVMNYLRITGLEVGLILNFRHPRLEYKRVILQTAR